MLDPPPLTVDLPTLVLEHDSSERMVSLYRKYSPQVMGRSNSLKSVNDEQVYVDKRAST